MPKQVVVTGAFDNLRSWHLRFLEAAARLGELTVLLWSDAVAAQVSGAAPKFVEAERQYLLRSIRFVQRVELVNQPFGANDLPALPGFKPDLWIDFAAEQTAARQAFAAAHRLEYRVLREEDLRQFPRATSEPVPTPGRKKVVVTGCYDWFHSGHVRFFEEVSAYGDLYVCVGNDQNIGLLKGPGHPLLPEDERCYMVGSIRFVKQALLNTGSGWLDADPEIRRLKPDIYAVNEDGDKGGKREYCQKLGIEYLVLKRTPAPGLPGRSSTALRGF